MSDIPERVKKAEEEMKSKVENAELEYINCIQSLVKDNNIEDIIKLNRKLKQKEKSFRERTEKIEDLLHKFIFYSVEEQDRRVEGIVSIRDKGVYAYNASERIRLQEILDNRDIIRNNLDSNKDKFNKICDLLIKNVYYPDYTYHVSYDDKYENSYKPDKYLVPMREETFIYEYSPYGSELYCSNGIFDNKYEMLNNLESNKGEVDRIYLIDYLDNDEFQVQEEKELPSIDEDNLELIIERKESIRRVIRTINRIIDRNNTKQKEIWSEIKSESQEIVLSHEI
jgi:hypothetical protein